MLAIIAAGTVISSPALSELSANDAIDRYRNNDAMLYQYVLGLGSALSWANSELAGSKRHPLFCIPVNVVLTVDQQIDILARHITHTPANGELPVGGVLLFALQEAFPCPVSN